MTKNNNFQSVPKLKISENKVCIGVAKAVDLLKQGELIGLPTETVYGLAAIATNTTAINNIFKLKGRPNNHPLILHVHQQEQLDDYAVNIPDYARILWQKFSPGPLTLILQKQPHLSDTITGGQQTIGIRSPNHELAQQILQQAGAVVAPSANPFGKTSPSCAAHVLYHFPDLAVVNGDHSFIGIESTIIDCSNIQPKILRHGEIQEQEIQNVLMEYGYSLNITNITEVKRIDSPRFSGEMKAHYAPMIPLLLLDNENVENIDSIDNINNINKIIQLAQKKHTTELTVCVFYWHEQQQQNLIQYQQKLQIQGINLHIHYEQFVEKEQYAFSLYDMFYSYLTEEVKGSKNIDLLFIGSNTDYKAVSERLQKAVYGSWQEII